jgi:hypothetical protein
MLLQTSQGLVTSSLQPPTRIFNNRQATRDIDLIWWWGFPTTRWETANQSKRECGTAPRKSNLFLHCINAAIKSPNGAI